MEPRPPAIALLIILSAVTASSLAAPVQKPAPVPSGTQAPGVAPRRNILYINGLPDTAGVFLPDTAVLARVEDHAITSGDFINAYYNAYAPDRPAQDSTGRVEWLNSMINKEVLGRVAREVNRPLDYEDRLQLRQHTQRVLSNVLFARAVLDSITIGEDEIRAIYPQFAIEHHLRRLDFADGLTARHAWSDLMAKRLTWEEAARRYAIPSDDAKVDGDIGWRGRSGMSFEVAAAVYSLKPGEISRVIDATDGYFIFQSLAERKVQSAEYHALRRYIWGQLRTQRIKEQADRLQDVLRREIGMQYDSANIVFASSRFEPAVGTELDPSGVPTLHINPNLPVFAPADTSRVLARYDKGQITIGGFLQSYSLISTVRRSAVNSFESFRRQLDEFVLEPFKARLAEKRRLDQDPLAVALIEKERERILVEHLYRDSIESKIVVSPQERRKYYQSHLARFITYPRVRYATLAADDSAGAEVLADRLRKGERADAILRADSIAGRAKIGAIHEEGEDEHTIYHGLVFGVLKPGRFQITGPGKQGVYVVVQVLEFDPGRQLSFKESEGYAHDALQSIAAEELLKKFLARHQRRFRIESHPDRVMRIRLVDPAALAN